MQEYAGVSTSGMNTHTHTQKIKLVCSYFD